VICFCSWADCKLNDKTPVANATQHSPLQFQSGKGKDCLKYMVKNGERGLLMPVRWIDKDTVLLDANIPKGPTDWICVVHTSYRHDRGKTSFRYGRNKDEFKDEPQAFRADPARETAVTGSVFSTSVKGLVADKQGKAWNVDMKVLSSYDPKRRLLRYEFQMGSDAPATFLRLSEKEDPGVELNLPQGRLKIQPPRRTPNGLELVWLSPAPKSLLLAAQAQKIRFVDEDLVRLTDQSEPLVLSVAQPEGADVTVCRRVLLCKVGGEVILSTTAPAYRVMTAKPKK